MKKNGKSEIQFLEEISVKLDKLIGILAIQGKNNEEQIKVLASLGFTNAEISKLTGMPKGTVDFKRAKNKKR